jgi:hypothetical protein
MRLFVCVYDDAGLLPHFLRHYGSVGVTQFHVAAPPDLADVVTRSSNGFDLVRHEGLDVADSLTGGSSAVMMMREQVQAQDEWSVVVDLDEFVEFGSQVTEVVARMDDEGANVARGIMYDRFAVDGQPTAVDQAADLESLFPIRARFIKEVMSGYDLKRVLVKGLLRPCAGAGHHVFEGERPASQVFDISHYKWREGSVERMRRAYEIVHGSGVPWSHEYKKVLDHYDRHGRFAWEEFGGERVAVDTHG